MTAAPGCSSAITIAAEQDQGGERERTRHLRHRSRAVGETGRWPPGPARPGTPSGGRDRDGSRGRGGRRRPGCHGHDTGPAAVAGAGAVAVAAGRGGLDRDVEFAHLLVARRGPGSLART